MQQFGRSKTGNKELPIGSRLTHQKWVDHCSDLHRHRLATMRPTIDNKWSTKAGSNQPSYPHLTSNAKKAQVAGDRQAERELENYMLLSKLSKCALACRTRAQRTRAHTQPATHPRVALCRTRARRIMQREPLNAQRSVNTGAPVYVLHATQRYNELKRVHAENLKLVHRIQAKRPAIVVDEFERDFEQSRKYKEMISLFSEQRISRGSSVVPSNSTTPRVLTPRGEYGAQAARSRRVRPSSASVQRPVPARSRPNSAGPIAARRRQMDPSAAPYHQVWSDEPPAAHGDILTSDAQLGSAAF